MKISIATVDITPTKMLDLAGYGGRIQPMTGIHDHLFVRALYMRNDAGQRLLWIHTDLVALMHTFVENINATLLLRHGLVREEIVVSATHTHSAPPTIHLINCGDVDPEYLEFVRGKILEAAAKAIAAPAEQVEVVAGAGISNVAIDRRHKARPEVEGHVDPRVGLVGFRRADGTWAAILANYAMHNTMLPYDSRILSGDVAGFVQANLEKNLAGNPMVMFTNGACGNINPRFKSCNFDEVEGLAKELASDTADGLKNCVPIKDESIRSVCATVPLPLDSVELSTKFANQYLAEIDDKNKKVNAIANTDDPTGYIKNRLIDAGHKWLKTTGEAVAAGTIDHFKPIELQVIAIGPVRFVCGGAEVFSKMREQLSEKTGCDVTFVGYTGGDCGYLATREAFADGGYEVDMSHIFEPARLRNAPGGFELLRDRAVELLKSLK